MIYGEEYFDDELIKMIESSKSGSKDHKAHRHQCYYDCVSHATEMSWHLYGEKPIDLLSRVRPREDPDVTKYRIDNYEPTTKSAADKAINIVSKIFNPNLYSIRWKEENESSKKLKEFSLEYYPEYNSIVNYTKEVLLRKMLADPNGVVAIKPENLPGYTEKMDETGEIVKDDSGAAVMIQKTSEEINPITVIYGSASVWGMDSEHYLVFLKSEEEQIKDSKVTWYYFEYYDAAVFRYFRARVTSKHELVREEFGEYTHNFGEVPVWKLQGKSCSLDTGEVIYKSFFDAAVPYWNLAIIHESDVLGAYINHIHPMRAELSEPCNYVHEKRFHCKSGWIVRENGERFPCPHCEGSGYKPMGPYGVFKVSRDKLTEDGGRASVSEAVSYITVPTEATKMLEERAARMEKKGMWAINMDVEDEVGENQSGIAKVIDRSAQYDTLYNIGSVVFDVHLQNIFYFFNKYMFEVSDKSRGKDSQNNLPEINKPTQFDIASTSELVNNYKAAKDSGLDRNYLQVKQIEIGTRDLTTNPDLKAFTNLLLDLDPLPGMDDNTISLNVSRLFVRQVDAVVHNNLKRFLERAMDEDKSFMQKSKKEQKEKLESYATEFMTQNKPVIDPTILEYGKPRPKPAVA